jgi:hypothetical protein
MAYKHLTAFPSQFVDGDGLPLSGGSISAFLAGSTTPTTMYTDGGTAAGTVITLNARGEPEVSGNTINIWVNDALAGGYKFVLKNALGGSVWTVDNISVLPTPTPPNYAAILCNASATIAISGLTELADAWNVNHLASGAVADEDAGTLTATVAGVYRCSLSVGSWSGTASKEFSFFLLKNDDVFGFAVANAETDAATDGQSIFAMNTIEMEADDYIRAAVTTGDGATSITIVSAGLHMELIDPA